MVGRDAATSQGSLGVGSVLVGSLRHLSPSLPITLPSPGVPSHGGDASILAGRLRIPPVSFRCAAIPSEGPSGAHDTRTAIGRYRSYHGGIEVVTGGTGPLPRWNRPTAMLSMVVGAAAAALTAWWVTGLSPFTIASYVAVGLPVALWWRSWSVARLVSATRWWSQGRPRCAPCSLGWCSRRSASGSRHWGWRSEVGRQGFLRSAPWSTTPWPGTGSASCSSADGWPWVGCRLSAGRSGPDVARAVGPPDMAVRYSPSLRQPSSRGCSRWSPRHRGESPRTSGRTPWRRAVAIWMPGGPPSGPASSTDRVSGGQKAGRGAPSHAEAQWYRQVPGRDGIPPMRQSSGMTGRGSRKPTLTQVNLEAIGYPSLRALSTTNFIRSPRRQVARLGRHDDSGGVGTRCLPTMSKSRFCSVRTQGPVLCMPGACLGRRRSARR